MMQAVRCNLCGQDDWFVRFPATLEQGQGPNVSAFRCTSPIYGHHAQIVQCRSCGYVYANPRWVGEEILQAYTAVEDELYVQERQGRELTFKKHLEALQRVAGPAGNRKLLDVGAYIGVFVEVARTYGWQAFGVEPSTWAVEVGQRRGIPILPGTQAQLLAQGQRYDLITMWDVIEHFGDPLAELNLSYQLLNPGGYIVIHTMDINSLTARLMGSRWPWLMEMHIHYFSQKTMAAMLKKCGFKLIWSGSQGRYLRLGYLGTRVEGINRPLGRLTQAVIRRLRLGDRAVPINLGDLFTVYARK